MKNIIIVDIDTERKEAVRIGKPPEFAIPDNESDQAEAIINDMATLCEGICTLIHLAKQNGIKNGADSLRDCIKHLEAGFTDASYKSYVADNKYNS